ncbi:MAG: hypothetical protein ACPGVN_08885, partial [Alphaproteobacteria bacterium]
MKTTFFASCALAAIALCSNAYATEVYVGGMVEFIAQNGKAIDDVNENNKYPGAPAPFAGHVIGNYSEDAVVKTNTTFTTNADVTFKTNVKTHVLEYGAYVNLDLDNVSNAGANGYVSDIDAHIRVRFAHGTFKFGTDIDGLQGAEDLDWVTVGPEDFTNSITAGMTNFSDAGDQLNDHLFTQGVKKSSLKSSADGSLATALDESSINF